MPPFRHFAADHLAAVILTLVVAVFMIVMARRTPEHLILRWLTEILAWAVLLGYPWYLWIGFQYGFDDQNAYLPMHLCHWAAAMSFVALKWRNQTSCELVYFWGLAGTSQALLTPNITVGFPHPGFVQFFLLHGGIVVAALYVTFGQGIRPRPGAVWRAWLWCQVYIVAACVTNWIANSNYGYLRAKPEGGSLMDYLGPEPYHILSLECLGLALFYLLNLPFVREQRLLQVAPCDREPRAGAN